MIRKYSFALLLMIPALFFGNNIGFTDDNGKPEPRTVAESKANAAYFAVQLPDDPNCSGSDTFSWENNVSITNSGAVSADVRFVDSRTALTYQIPGPYPIEFANPVTININEAISWDGYANRQHTPDQLYERWRVVFLKNGVVQFESDYTGDLQDGVDSAQWKGALNQNIDLPNGVDQILLVHYEDNTYGTARVASANSVVPSSICFSYDPICDITVDAGVDIEECTDENIELSATYVGGNQCVTGCVYPVLDTDKCGGDSEEIWLGAGSGSERKFQASTSNFETFSNGTAQFTAIASNGIDNIQVNLLYSGRTTDAPANSPKDHSCGAIQDVSNFVYYTTLVGTIVSQEHGTFNATSMGPSFQIGVGADVERPGFGASGWFNLSGGDGYYPQGDVNIPLGACVEQGSDEVSILWSTSDGTIVGAANQQTIAVSETGTYTVTVTNCNGCEATDTVEVNILEKLTIGDFAWEDLNRNGLQDTDEPGVDDMSVALYTADGTLVESTVTANGGAYSFEVCPGEYYVVFGNVPAGFEFTNTDTGDDATDSDANANGRTPNFVLSDTDNPTIDAGILALCNLDPTISGDEEVCSGEAATLTATGGNSYLWSTGETTASVTVAPTTTTTYTVMVSDSTITDCEEALQFTVNVTEQLSIGDFVWEDLNRNGLYDSGDAGEPGVDGLSVTLFTANGSVSGSTTTADGGAYNFEVCPGEYYVVFGNVPADYTFTNADAGDDSLDSDANANGRTPNFIITDSDNLTIDAGLVKLCTIDPAVSGDEEVCSGEPATLTATGGDTYLWSTGETTGTITVAPTDTTTYTVTVSDSTIPDCSEALSFTVNVTEQLTIGDFVFDDADRNGLQGANETGVDGLTVTLYTANGTVAGSTTSVNGGEYTFDVCPGEYYIVFGNVPADYAFTNADAGDDSLDSDANANGRTPNFVITDSDNMTIDAGLVKLCTIDPTIVGGVEVCSGEESLIIVTGGNTFLWSTGATTPFINVRPTVTTTYTVVVSDSTIPDCSETLVFTVNVTEKFTIGDFVFEDVNRNGLQDTDEPGVNNLLVTLYHVAGDVAGSTVTTNGGKYDFDVCPGEYYVVFGDVPAGYTFTNADAGDDSLDSDANANGLTPSFVITDSDNLTIDAGLVKLCNIDPTVVGDEEICAGEVSTLVATGGDTYLWSTGETTATIQVAPEATTTYTVVVSDTATADCSEQVAFTVMVQSVDIDAGPDVIITFGDSTNLTVTGADASDSIIWSTGETTTSITVAPDVTATYSVTVVNALGCIDEDSVTVTVNDECGVKPAFKILPRDQPGVYAPGNETAACIGDDLYLWMYIDLENLNDPLVEDYTEWTFTYEFPNGTVIVQNDLPNYPGNHRAEKLDLTEEDFGAYKISWVSPSGCTGATVFTLNFPDEGCGDNGTRISDFFGIDAVYPVPAPAGSMITLEISTKSQSISSLSDKNANNTSGKTPDLVSRMETIRVSLYNFDGRMVGETQTFDVEQGKVKVHYQLGNLATGNYIIKVEGDVWKDSKQIMVK